MSSPGGGRWKSPPGSAYPHIPVGTAIGVYALWVLTAEEAGAYFGEPATSPTG